MQHKFCHADVWTSHLACQEVAAAAWVVARPSRVQLQGHHRRPDLASGALEAVGVP